MEKLFIEWFVDDIIKKLKNSNEELKELRKFKEKVVGYHQTCDYEDPNVNICECGSVDLANEEFTYFHECECCNIVYCSSCLSKDYLCLVCITEEEGEKCKKKKKEGLLKNIYYS